MKFITKVKLVILLVIFLGAKFYYNYSWEISALITAGVVILYFLLKGKFKRKKPSRYISDETKEDVLKRFGYKCALCGSPNNGILEFHHRKKFSQNGQHTEGNLLCVCPNCHSLLHAQEAGKNLKVNYR